MYESFFSEEMLWEAQCDLQMILTAKRLYDEINLPPDRLERFLLNQTFLDMPLELFCLIFGPENVRGRQEISPIIESVAAKILSLDELENGECDFIIERLNEAIGSGLVEFWLTKEGVFVAFNDEETFVVDLFYLMDQFLGDCIAILKFLEARKINVKERVKEAAV